MEAPLAVIGGHKKAVSYVRFLGGDQLVSASTDNKLKLWDINQATTSQGKCEPLMTYSGDLSSLSVDLWKMQIGCKFLSADFRQKTNRDKSGFVLFSLQGLSHDLDLIDLQSYHENLRNISKGWMKL